MTKTLYYPVWLSQGASPPYMTGKPCDSAGEAKQELAAIMADYAARGFPSAFGCVVKSDGQGKQLLLRTIQPIDARLGARHCIGILDQYDAMPVRE